VNSPQLLMLSGVGPAALLRELGIKVAAGLPAGENLHDHPRRAAAVVQRMPCIGAAPRRIAGEF
jgi:choline dehydrogenase-like flavoprotein